MPLLPQHIDIEDVKIDFLRTDDAADELLAVIANNLSAVEKTVYQSFKNDRRRREWLATRILLKEMLGHYPQIVYDANGAPMLSGVANTYYISVSHTDGIVAALLSKHRAGIDIERVTKRVLRIKDKFLMPVEYNYIPDCELLHLLYIQWCAKEAMYKACNVAKYDYQHTYTLPDYHFDGNMQGKANGKVVLDDGSVKELIVNYFEIEGCVCCVAY